MSISLQPHGLYSPWNSLGQNTGVGSLSLLQWIFLTQESNWGLLHCRRILYQLSYQGRPKICDSHSAVSNSLPPHELYSPWNSPGQNMGMGSLSLLQWIFPSQGLNAGLLYCRRILYQLSYQYGVLESDQEERMASTKSGDVFSFRDQAEKSESHIWLFVAPWTIQSMEFSRPEYWSG